MIPVTVGADPELLIRVKGASVPCVGLFPGTKKEPFSVPNSRYGLTVQEDGVCLELGFSPVSVESFADTVHNVYTEALVYLRSVIPGAEFQRRCFEKFDPKQLVTAQARTLGCDPDNLAHDGGVKRLPPKVQELGDDRFAGGHIHIGYDKKATPVPETAIVQFMDLAYLTDINEGRDPQGGRRKFYGLAGLYRSKSYGVEYRTPSNYWFMNWPSSGQWIAKIAEAVINKPSLARSIYKQIDWPLVAQSINEERPLINMDMVFDFIEELTSAESEIGEDAQVEAA